MTKRPEIGEIAALGAEIWNFVVSAPKAAALPACTNSITACCEITSGGTYVLANALTSTDPAADCIDVNAADVNLFDAGNDISGPGGSATGAGVNILKKAKNAKVLLEDPNPAGNRTLSFISGFGTGVAVSSATGSVLGGFDAEDNAAAGISINGGKNCQIYDFDADFNATGILMSGGSGCSIHDFDADDNTGSGVSLTKVKSTTFYDFQADGNSVSGLTLGAGSTKNNIHNFSTDSNGSSGVIVQTSNSNQIQDFDSYDNADYGLWLVTANSNTVSYAFTFGNALAGIYLGCSITGPGAMCSTTASTKNTIQGASTGNDGSIAQAHGVAVDVGDLKNTLSGIGASGDTTTDLLDNNANCGTNVWAMTSAGATNPSSCIATTP